MQDVTRRSLASDARERSLVEALGWVSHSFPFGSDDVRFWLQAEALLPHVRTVTAHAETVSIAEPTAELMNQLALHLNAKALHREAEPFYRRALAITEKSYGPDHPDVAICLNNLAGLLRATNRLAEAEPPMRRHVAIFVEFTRRTGHPHPHLKAAFNNYAGVLADMGKSKKEIEVACAALMLPLEGMNIRSREAAEGDRPERV